MKEGMRKKKEIRIKMASDTKRGDKKGVSRINNK
jgi:hypothetical protein